MFHGHMNNVDGMVLKQILHFNKTRGKTEILKRLKHIQVHIQNLTDLILKA